MKGPSQGQPQKEDSSVVTQHNNWWSLLVYEGEHAMVSQLAGMCVICSPCIKIVRLGGKWWVNYPPFAIQGCTYFTH